MRTISLSARDCKEKLESLNGGSSKLVLGVVRNFWFEGWIYSSSATLSGRS